MAQYKFKQPVTAWEIKDIIQYPEKWNYVTLIPSDLDAELGITPLEILESTISGLTEFGRGWYVVIYSYGDQVFLSPVLFKDTFDTIE